MSSHVHEHGELILHGNGDEDELFQQHDEHGELPMRDPESVSLKVFRYIPLKQNIFMIWFL